MKQNRRCALALAFPVFLTAGASVPPREIDPPRVQDRIDSVPSVQGRFTHKQLEDWLSPMIREVLAVQGTVLVDHDERRNRLVVGVEQDTLARVVYAIAARLRIPSEAVIVEKVDPVKDDATLREENRPIRGGLQIQREAGGICTLGFSARRGSTGALSFITNSHCTATIGSVDNALFHQATDLASNANRVGTEVSDPPFVDIPFVCPSGRTCRLSDAARVRYDTAVSVSFGRLMRTSGPNNGSIDIVGSFTIINEGSIPLAGIPVSKMGRTTGWTRGPLKRTCTSVNKSGTNLTLICQSSVSADRAGGDSGAPIFLDLSRNRAILLGIHWGGNSEEAFFSTIGGIEADLGSLKTF